MLSVSIWDEGLPTLALLGAAALALRGGYWSGGALWRVRHSIPIGGESSKRPISGVYGELVVLAMLAIGVLIVMVSCPDVGLYHADGPEFAFVLLWFACVYGGAYLYSRQAIKAGVRKEEVDGIKKTTRSGGDDETVRVRLERQLKWAYRIYNLYTCVLFGLGGLALAKVALQFRHDWQANALASQQLVDKAEALLAIQPAMFDLDAIVEVERAYLSFRHLLSDVLVQVEPIAFLFLYVMLMSLLISLTPLSRAFRDSARRMGSTVSLLAVVGLLAISLVSYFIHAIDASRGLADALSHMQSWSATDHRHYMRYSQIYRDVKAAGAVSGFIRALLSEAVFLVIVVGVAQQAASGVRNLVGRSAQ